MDTARKDDAIARLVERVKSPDLREAYYRSWCLELCISTLRSDVARVRGGKPETMQRSLFAEE